MLESLDELLSSEMSDEAAYHLVNFMVDLSLALESHFFRKIKRYSDENFSTEFPSYLK